jgi:hypothetical protein
MMRKVFSVALIAALACVFGLAQSANAGVTIDVVFVDATSPTGITIQAGDPGPGCTFSGYYETVITEGRCMNVIMTTTEEFISMGVSVSYDSDNGLALASVYEWRGVGVEFTKTGVATKSCGPFGPIVDNGGILQAFDCSVPPPNAPPQAAAGTYQIGTIVWDTSGTTGPNTETISAVIAGGDGFIAVINGNITSISDQVVVRSHILNIIPEPGTASLLGLGLVGLILAGRRSRA